MKLTHKVPFVSGGSGSPLVMCETNVSSKKQTVIFLRRHPLAGTSLVCLSKHTFFRERRDPFTDHKVINDIHTHQRQRLFQRSRNKAVGEARL